VKLPDHAPVMILPEATLFPKAMLPLFIFEPRYRRMLADTLAGERMFAVAARKRASSPRETPAAIAGLGLIHTCVQHPDGTSHLVLEGLARVRLLKPARYRPYRTYRLCPMETTRDDDDDMAGALAFKVRELAVERLEQNLQGNKPLPNHPATQLLPAARQALAAEAVRAFIRQLGKVNDPGQLADLVSCALLSRHAERQVILETASLEERLMRLIQFLIVETKLPPGAAEIFP
jgi:Lon protease-like protein